MLCQSLPLLVCCGQMNSQGVNQSPLVNPTVLPLLPPCAVATDNVLVVAPHPDDETLGCGRAIALLRSLNCKVQVLVISDGTLSHPRRKYPAPALRTLRESETLAAMSLLGVEASDVTFLGLPDGAIPTQTFSQVKDAIALCCPNTIFLPLRYDPHL